MEHSLLEPLRHFARWLFGAPFQELPPEFGDPVPPDLRAFETNALVDQTSPFPEPGFSRALTKAGAAGIAAPVAPPAPKPPKVTTTTPKPVSVLDGRTDKPEGMNLMQGIQTVSNGADVGSSYSSFGRRLQGSPV